MRRLFWCCLIVMSLGMAACKAPQPVGNVLRVAVATAPKSLDPRFASDATGMRIAHHLIFSPLVQLGDDLTIQPVLATSWEMPDPLTYVFHLRDGVTFSDGTPLAAEDVKFTFEHVMNPKLASPFAASFGEKIRTIEVKDPLTVVFRLTAPNASFLTSIIFPILPKALLEKDPEGFKETLIGSGPFVLVDQSSNEVTLARNPTYFGGAPAIEKIVVKVVSDDNTRILKLKKGDIDVIVNDIPRESIADIQSDEMAKSYSVIESPSVLYSYLVFNTNDKELKDRRLRSAIADAIDVDEIIQHRLEGHAVRSLGLLSPVNWYYDKSVAAHEYNPKRAIHTLEELGYHDPDGEEGPIPRLTLELKVSNSPEVVAVARVIQSQLTKVGIFLDLKSYEWGTFYGDVQEGNFQLAQLQWVGVTDPDFYYDIFHSSMVPPKGRNRGHYASLEMDRLVTLGRAETDPNKRRSIYNQVQHLAALDVPYVGLWHANIISVVAKRVNGYRPSPTGGYYSFKDMSLTP